jgi:hypothetical protein
LSNGLNIRDRLIQSSLTVLETVYYRAVELSFQSTDYSQERKDPAQKFQILQNGVLVLVPHSAAGHGNATFEKVVDKRNASSM